MECLCLLDAGLWARSWRYQGDDDSALAQGRGPQTWVSRDTPPRAGEGWRAGVGGWKACPQVRKTAEAQRGCAGGAGRSPVRLDHCTRAGPGGGKAGSETGHDAGAGRQGLVLWTHGTQSYGHMQTHRPARWGCRAHRTALSGAALGQGRAQSGGGSGRTGCPLGFPLWSGLKAAPSPAGLWAPSFVAAERASPEGGASADSTPVSCWPWVGHYASLGSCHGHLHG